MHKFTLSNIFRKHSKNPKRIILPLLAVLLLTGTVVLHFSGIGTSPVSATPVVVFPGTVLPLIAHSHFDRTEDLNRRIALTIGLRPRDTEDLTRYAADISNPKSVNFHRYLSSAQITDIFGPTPAAQNVILQFLRASGFTITQTFNHRLLIGFSGTIGQVEQVFHVAINTYSAPGGHVFYANANEPVLPASIVGMVQSISGLNDATQLQHSPQRILTVSKTSALSPNAVNCPPPVTNTSNKAYLLPGQVAQGYNIDGLYNAGYHGEGQTIGLFELDTYQVTDIKNYESCFGQSRAPIQTIVTGQNPISTGQGALEVELDAELILSTVPQLGTLKIYEAANDMADINAEWARIIQDAPPVVSTSWGACEQNVGLQEAQQENIFFAEAAAQGQTIFAASGDSGSEGCYLDTPSSTILNVGDPASQPFVTGVGGTELHTSPWGSYYNEFPWVKQNGASGGGISQFWTLPTWQQGVINNYSSGTPCNAAVGTDCREVPDVSLNAAPNTGYPVYCSSTAAHCSSSGNWYVVGGTSAAAPMWAAWMAMTNEMSLKEGGFNLGFINPLLYQVLGSSSFTTSFNSLQTVGYNNDWLMLHNGQYSCYTFTNLQYNMCSGMGSYIASGLATTLVSLAHSASGTRSSPANSTWYFAEGSVGGGFTEYLTMQNPDPAQTAMVNVTYLFQSQPSRTISRSIPASTRATINVNQDLGIRPTDAQQAISAIVQVTSGPGIVVERPMYFNFKGIQSGTDVIGATKPGTSFYFPEANTVQTGRNYYTYITMLNPSAAQTANATVTFYTGSCGLANQPACATQTITVPPLHRGTVIPPWFEQMSIAVTSDTPMVVERPMYFRDTIPNADGLTSGAASVVGASAPGDDWLFAEGYTGAGFQEYFVLANYAVSATTATITLEYSNGSTQAVQVQMPALGRTIFDVNQANANPTGACNPSPCATTPNVSAEITSSGQIVADRLMYFHYGASHISGGTETVGEAGPASHSVYAFAEGYTANTFVEYLTLQNPTNADETVAVTLFADSFVMQQQLLVKAHSRQTITMNNLVVPIAQSYDNMGANSFAVSLTVQALGANARVVAERPMYFDYYGDPGGTDTIGYAGG